MLRQKKGYILVLLVTLPNFLIGQCAMCRAQLESMEDDSMAEGINNGIMLLMAVPYVLAAVMGFIIYKKFVKKTS